MFSDEFDDEADLLVWSVFPSCLMMAMHTTLSGLSLMHNRGICLRTKTFFLPFKTAPFNIHVFPFCKLSSNFFLDHFSSRDLFNAAFVSCWVELPEQQQDELVACLEQALHSQNLPEITQPLLNLAEFMEHCEKVRVDKCPCQFKISTVRSDAEECLAEEHLA